MIVWTGWGFLAPVIILGGMLGIEPVLEHRDVGEPWPNVVAGILVAVVLWFFGRWLNVGRPRARAARVMPAREAEVGEAVEAGLYAPGGIRPTSLAEARTLAEQQLADERKQLVDAGYHHSFFFLPMHWWAVILLGFIAWNAVSTLLH